jgi:hypothetical protein
MAYMQKERIRDIECTIIRSNERDLIGHDFGEHQKQDIMQLKIPMAQ